MKKTNNKATCNQVEPIEKQNKRRSSKTKTNVAECVWEVAAVPVKVTIEVILGAAPSAGAATVTGDDRHHLRRGVGGCGGKERGRCWRSCPHAADECVRSASVTQRFHAHPELSLHGHGQTLW